MSGLQTEGAHNKGGKLPNFWDMWSRLEINKFYNNVEIYVVNDFCNKVDMDFFCIIFLEVIISNYYFCNKGWKKSNKLV